MLRPNLCPLIDAGEERGSGELLSFRASAPNNERAYHLCHPPCCIFLPLFRLQQTCQRADGLIAAAMRFLQMLTALQTSCPNIHLRVRRTDKRAAWQDHRLFGLARRKHLPGSYKSKLAVAQSLGDLLLHRGSQGYTDCPVSPIFPVFVYEHFEERSSHGSLDFQR